MSDVIVAFIAGCGVGILGTRLVMLTVVEQLHTDVDRLVEERGAL